MLDKKVANIVVGPTGDRHMIRPHMLLLHSTGFAVPLSTYMAGHEAMVAYPGQRWKPDERLEVEYLGDEELLGHPCQKVKITTCVGSSRRPHSAWILWLAIDRNYLPIRQEAYTYHYSKSDPVGVGVAKDLREIAPGIWFPFVAEITAFDKDVVRAEQRSEPIWRHRYTVESVDMKPDYPVAFFRDLDISVMLHQPYVGSRTHLSNREFRRYREELDSRSGAIAKLHLNGVTITMSIRH